METMIAVVQGRICPRGLVSFKVLHDVCIAQGIASRDKTHVCRNLVLSKLLRTSSRHRASTIFEEDTIPTIGVRIGHCAKHALVSVDTGE